MIHWKHKGNYTDWVIKLQKANKRNQGEHSNKATVMCPSFRPSKEILQLYKFHDEPGPPPSKSLLIFTPHKLLLIHLAFSECSYTIRSTAPLYTCIPVSALCPPLVYAVFSGKDMYKSMFVSPSMLLEKSESHFPHQQDGINIYSRC